MSGQQIGTVVGTVVGFWLPGGPSVWGAIGGYVGGVIDPTVIQGPSIGDAQRQTSLGGQPIPKCYGHTPPIAPTLIDGDKIARKIKRSQDVGKGATQKTETEAFIATRAFLVCEGEIEGYARITRNGKLVYTTQPSDSLDADSAAFASQITIYKGSETQGPDPSLEAIHGVGNTPYYRGRSYFVVRDDDETQTGGAANQYRVEVVAIGTTAPGEVALYPGRLSEITNSHFPLADNPSEDYEFVGFWQTGNGGGVASPTFDTIGQVKAFFANVNANDGTTGVNNLGSPDIYVGYIADSGDDAGDAGTSTKRVDIIATQPDARDLESVLLLYQWVNWVAEYDVTPQSFCPILSNGSDWVMAGNGSVIRRVLIPTSGDYGHFSNCDDLGYGPGQLESIYPLCVKASRKRLQPKSGAQLGYVEAPDAPGYFVNPIDSSIYHEPTYTPISGTFKVLSIPSLSGGDPSRLYDYYENGPVLALGDPDYNDSVFWTDAYDAKVASGGLPAGWTYGTQFPTEIAQVWEGEMSGISIAPDAAVWKDVVSDISGRASELLPAHLDIAHMTDEVPGFVLGNASLTGTDYVRTLCTFYFTDLPEYDGQMHAVRRGASVVATFDENDILTLEDEDDDSRRQAIGSFQRITVMYPDPANKYVPTPQTAARTSPDVTANSNITLECPIPFSATLMAQKADIIQKIAFLQVEGTIKRAFPAEYSRFVPSDPIMFDNRRYLITKAANDDSMVRFEYTYDRPSAYTSTASGNSGPTPEPQTSNVKGSALLVAMNLPSLRSADNVPGMYIAVTGLLPGWPGCDVYMSVDAGVSEQKVLTINTSSQIGELAQEMGVDSSGEPLFVTMYNHEQLESVTSQQLAVRANAAAVITDDLSEIIQFQTAHENSSGDFELTTIIRGGLETLEAEHAAGDRFVMLEGATFLPIDLSHSGQTLIFRAVTFGTATANNATVSAVFDPPTFIIDGGEVT